MADKNSRATRRAVIGGVGAAAFAGCLSLGGSGDGSNDEPTETPGETPTATPGETPTETPTGSDRLSWNELGTSIERFEETDHWSPVDDATVSFTDAEGTDGDVRPFTGARSMVVEGEGITQAHGSFRSNPLDISDSNLSVAIRPDEPNVSRSFYVWALDPEGRRADFHGVYAGGLDSGWVRYDLRLGDYDEGFDFGYVTELRLRVTADEACRFLVDDIRATPKPDRGKAMLIFDDINASQYDNGFELLQKHELRAAYAVVTDLVNRRHRMTGRELNEVEDAGCELISHTVSHERLAGRPAEEQREELVRSKERLQELASNPESAEHVVYPKSAYDRETLKLVDEHYEMGYADNGPCAAAVTDPRTVARFNWADRDIESLRSAIDRTAENRELAVIYFHDIEGEDVQKLDDLLAHVAGADVDVIVPTELQALQEELAGR